MSISIQHKVNEAYRKCEDLRSEIALLTAMYNSRVSLLQILVSETGVKPNVRDES
jgi:hypothetical protein